MRAVVIVAALLAVPGCRSRDDAAPVGAARPKGEAPVRAAADPERAHVHFLVPGAPGGGWDGTARAVGEALVRSGLAPSVSYENLSGGGGGRALAHFIATAERQDRTLLVTSTPIVIASLRSGRGGYHDLRSNPSGAADGASGRLPRSWRDLEPVASVIGDYLTFAARSDAPFDGWSDVVAAFRSDPAAVKIAGGSVVGGMDHLVTALALDAAGADASALRYVPYDAGGKARAALFSGEVPLLATGLGEILDARRAGLVRLLAVTAPQRLAEAGDVPTIAELAGTDVEFVNWRGFFAAPGTPPARVREWIALLEAVLATPEWEEMRRRNGWVEMFHAGADFERFLVGQESGLVELMERLGTQRGSRAAPSRRVTTSERLPRLAPPRIGESSDATRLAVATWRK
jgi:putative tricarboxylic transport membrane protein